MKKTLSAIMLTLLCSIANTQEPADLEEYDTVETWRCFAPSDYAMKKTLAALTKRVVKESPFVYGSINVAGVHYRTTFDVNGFDRRWNFGDRSEYSFIIKPNGSGLYYDFSSVADGETTSANQSYKCAMG